MKNRIVLFYVFILLCVVIASTTWALEGYRRLRDQGFIFSKSPSMQKSKRLYKQKNSSVIDFIESHFVEILAANQSVPFKDIYEEYRSFCLKEGIKRVSSKKDFRSTIESEGYLS